MRVVLSARDLKTILNAVNVLVSEARFRFTKQGLQIRAVDAANVAMVIVNAGAEIFDRYILESETVLGVDVLRLANVSKSLDSRSLAELAVVNKMLSLSSGIMTYTVALIDPDAIRKEPRLPNLDLAAEVVIGAGEFRKAISAVDRVSDEVVFEKTDTGFRIAGAGDVESVAYTFGNSELIEVKDGKARAKYSLEYVKEFCRIANEATQLKIRFDSDNICWLTFEIRTGFGIEYILAPRVER